MVLRRELAFLGLASGMVWPCVSLCATAPVQTVYTESWPPYSFERDGEIRGIAADLVVMLLTRANLPYQLDMQTWARSFHNVRFEPDTMLFLANRTPEREPLFQWVGPIVEAPMSVYRSADGEDLALADLDDLIHYKIAVEHGGSVESKLLKMGLSLEKNLVRTRSYERCLELLLDGHIDFYITEAFSLGYHMKLKSIAADRVVKVMPFEGLGAFYLALHRDTDPQLMKSLQAHWESMLDDGIRQRVIQRYLQ